MTDERMRTALFECHREAGARLVEFAGWEMPIQYAGVIDEHRAVRGAAGLFDVSHMGEILVSGDGAERFLQRITPNDVGKLKPGRAHYSGLLTEEATYVDDLLVYRLSAERFLLVVNAANTSDDFAWIEGLLDPELDGDVEVRDASADYALLALQGPRAAEVLQRVTGEPFGDLKYYGFAEGEVAGAPALVSRTGYTGEDGFELYVAPEVASGLWRALLEHGADLGLVPAGLGARDTLRLEAGMALYGHEIDRQTTPLDAKLGWVVKLAKDDFIGREVLARQREAGCERALVGFQVEGRGIARQGHPIVADGEPIGRVTSGTWSPTFEAALGMAYVPSAMSEPGTDLAIDVRGRQLAATVRELPFYRRSR